MPEELKNITDNVMDQIRRGKLKMRPKLYFIFGSILTIAGLAASVVVSVFFVSLTRFAFRAHGPMWQYRLEQLLATFPWWAPLLAIIGLAAGLWLLRQYEFSYKRKFWVIIIGFVAAILIAGWAIDAIGLDETWFRHGPMRGMMKEYLLDNDIQPSPIWRR